jgi:regulatory protein YycI of two-component signal transduction system YycFG
LEYSKIKNIVIAILLALNMFFLALFLIGRSESGKLEQQAKEDILSIYSAGGISIEKSVIPADAKISYYKMSRDLDREKQIAETVLGAKDMSAIGGSVYQYVNILGEALFYPQGDFAITLTNGKAFSDTSNSALIKYLKEMNFNVDSESIKVESFGGTKAVSFNFINDGILILNGKLTMIFEDSSLISISGKRPTSAPLFSDTSIMSVKTALVYFLYGIKNIDTSCSKVTEVSPAYFIYDSGSGSLVLLPVWRIETNSGNYYVNGLNGKVSAIID